MGSPLRLSPEELSAKYDLPAELAADAQQSFDSGSSLLLAFSGKMGAGKDSTAPIAFSTLRGENFRARPDAFGVNLKLELNGLISIIEDSFGVLKCARSISERYGVTEDEATHVVSLLYSEVKAGTIRSASDRTQKSRAALQYWATEVRRNQDSLYWVKPVIGRAIAAAALEGESTQITDVRFLTEVWGIIDAGGWTVRLDVSEAEQRRRILERDGIEVAEAAKAHSSETELDNFEHFSVRILTDEHSSAESVARAAAQGVSAVASTLF